MEKKGQICVLYVPPESEDFLTLPEPLFQKYEALFRVPERFVWKEDGIHAEKIVENPEMEYRSAEQRTKEKECHGRLFVDMDGTLAEFKEIDEIETLYEQGYFRTLKPQQSVLDAVKTLHADGKIEIYILSSCLSDSLYAMEEKNQWLDQYLPEVPYEKRLFPPCGESKLKWLEEHGFQISRADVLLDDYSKNLHEWDTLGTGIKLLNGINHTKGSWKGKTVNGRTSSSNIEAAVYLEFSQQKQTENQPRFAVVQNMDSEDPRQNLVERLKE